MRLYSYTLSSADSAFRVTASLILAALLAYLRVCRVSSSCLVPYWIHAIMIVFVFPPRDSFSSRVSFESR
jgi:hypothetical protein